MYVVAILERRKNKGTSAIKYHVSQQNFFSMHVTKSSLQQDNSDKQWKDYRIVYNFSSDTDFKLVLPHWLLPSHMTHHKKSLVIALHIETNYINFHRSKIVCDHSSIKNKVNPTAPDFIQ